jgi:hypothetical protein
VKLKFHTQLLQAFKSGLELLLLEIEKAKNLSKKRFWPLKINAQLCTYSQTRNLKIQPEKALLESPAAILDGDSFRMLFFWG